MLQKVSARIPAAMAEPSFVRGNSGLRLHLPMPPWYDRDPKVSQGFLNLCAIHFEVLANCFGKSEGDLNLFSLLSGEELAWANPLWYCVDPLMSSLHKFLSTFCKVYEETNNATSAASLLPHLHWCNSTVSQSVRHPVVYFWLPSSPGIMKFWLPPSRKDLVVW